MVVCALNTPALKLIQLMKFDDLWLHQFKLYSDKVFNDDDVFICSYVFAAKVLTSAKLTAYIYKLANFEEEEEENLLQIQNCTMSARQQITILFQHH